MLEYLSASMDFWRYVPDLMAGYAGTPTQRALRQVAEETLREKQAAQDRATTVMAAMRETARI